MGKEFLYKELSYKLQGSLFDIRNQYGPGQKESVYANLFAEWLESEGIPFEREKRLSIRSEKTGKTVGIYKPDFVVDGKIVIELKATRQPIQQDEQQLYYYLRNSPYELGYLVNFGLPKLFLKRIIYSNSRKPFLPKLASVILCLFVFSFAFIRGANAAELLLYPDPVELAPGGTELVEVRLDTQNQSVNAAQVVLNFSPQALVVRDVLFGGSVLPLQPEPPFIGTDTVKMSGGAPSGFTGSGILARLLVSASENVHVNSTQLTFDPITSVLLNDGKATAALLSMRPATVVFLSDHRTEVTSPSHPDSTKWYAVHTAIFHWEPEVDAQYSYKISRDPGEVPDDLADTPVGDIKFENLDDGVYYFTLRKLSDPPDIVTRVRVMIDTTAPPLFDVVITKQEQVYEGDFWYAVFTPQDALSGIQRVEIAEVRDKEEPAWYEAASPYVLRDQTRSLTLRVRAFDYAGSMVEATVPPLPQPPQWLYLAGGFVGLIAVIFLVQQRRRRRQHAIIGTGGVSSASPS